MGLFGTDGVRGVANRDLTIELAGRIGMAAGGLGSPARVLIGRDTRVSGHMLEAALAAGFTAVGVDVDLVGVLPTPALAYLIGPAGADIGVMISASHNPPEYNGIKLMDRSGRKWPAEKESEVEAALADVESRRADPLAIGQVRNGEDLVERYREHLVSLFAGTLPDVRVVIDCAHGAAIRTARPVLERLGVRVEAIHEEPDGELINRGCGATHPDDLRERVLAVGADVGLAFDGDADRVIAVDHTGHVVDGDEILYVLATRLKQREELVGHTVVATVMSNLGLERALGAEGIELVRTPVGDRYVADRLRDLGAAIGGEQSGHIILPRWATTGDGLLTGLALLQAMGEDGRPLAELVRPVERYPQVLTNVSLMQPLDDWTRVAGLAEAVQEAEADLGQMGRVLIRPSGTEPLLRIMLEGRDAGLIQQWAHRLTAVVSRALESAKA